VAALLAMPRAAGLFRRAIAQSVPGPFFTPELAADIGAAIAGELGLRATVADFTGIEPALLCAVGDAVADGIGSRGEIAGGGRAHLYELAWPAPGTGGFLGACHGLDVPLVFGNLTSGQPAMLLGDQPSADAADLSMEMRSAWARFAAGGDPGLGPDRAPCRGQAGDVEHQRAGAGSERRQSSRQSRV
jgi:carboxylesterase type B